MAKVVIAQPHAGHRAIADLRGMKPDLQLVTQNVDDLHERAGSCDVLHLHGQIAATRCRRCDVAQTIEIDPAWSAAPQLRAEPPACLRCGGPLRPGVVWFGEALPEQAFGRAVRAAQAADLVLVIGTSGLVHPAAGLPDLAPATCPRYEINPQPSALSVRMDGLWRASAGEALPRLVAALRMG
jgi:NAD-dependent deacetylase